MAKINSKDKGNKFERDMSNLLSERFKKHTGLEKSFRRNADSGSFFGRNNYYRTKTHDLDNACFGDIMTPKDFIFTIECKNYKTAPLLSAILKGKIKQWDDWLEQAINDSENANKSPILIVKYNGTTTIAFIKDNLEKYNIDFIFRYGEYYIYKLDDILSLNDTFFFS